MRGSHYGAWYPCSVSDSDPTYHDGPPRLVALGFQVNDGRLVGLEESGEHIPMDYFEGSCWDVVREEAMKQSMHMRRHGPFMPAILPPEEMEYTTLPAVRKKLEGRVEKL
jgi:fructose 1,6-bisphosphate aldolase/phosphatase